MKGLDIHLVRDRKELEQLFEIRTIVFIEGQNVPYEEEMDGLDDEATQIIACLDGQAVGCGRIRFLGNQAKLERLAVLQKYQGRGIGREILDFMVARSREKGATEAMMHAQCYANDFYRKCGFRPRGQEFMEAGIRHIEMYLDL
jgi:predicted GNAT family N-acyltransferase